MEKRIITEKTIRMFKIHLSQEEKSPITIKKYLRDAETFQRYEGEKEITKTLVLSYKQSLMTRYAARSVNSKLASLNSLFTFLDWTDCKVKNLKLQRQTFAAEERS